MIVEVKLELFKFELPLLQCIALVLSVLPIDGLMRCCSGCRVELVRLTALLALVSLVGGTIHVTLQNKPICTKIRPEMTEI